MFDHAMESKARTEANDLRRHATPLINPGTKKVTR
jgi:hypothetical protein